MLAQTFRTDAELVPPRSSEERRVAVLVNANARKVTPKVVRALSHVAGTGHLYISRSELDARRIAQQVVDRRYDTLLLGGGDGTVMCFINEVAHQVEHRRRQQRTSMPRFGVLKLGTGNSVASLVNASSPRSLGFVDDVLRARAGEVPGYRTVDLLVIDGKRAPFAGLGIDGRILNDYVWVKQTLAQGPLARVMTGAGGYFTSVALRTFPHYLVNSGSVDCEIVNSSVGVAYRMGPDGRAVGDPIAPGAVLYRGPLKMAAAATVPYYGFELRMFPFAAQRRGFAHLRVGEVSAAAVLANLPAMWRGQWFPEGIHDFLIRDATIRCAQKMPLQIGGDAGGYRDQLRLEVARDPIELLDFTGALN